MKNNLRMTVPRQKILAALEKCGLSVFSAKDLYKQVKDVDLATVYRNLASFEEAGLIRQIHLAGEEAKYEYVTDNHHHVICDDCGVVKHVKMSADLLDKIPDLKHFSENKYEITIRGKCGHLSK